MVRLLRLASRLEDVTDQIDRWAAALDPGPRTGVDTGAGESVSVYSFYNAKTGTQSSLPGDALRFGLTAGSVIAVDADGTVHVHQPHDVVLSYPPSDPEAIRLRSCFGPVAEPDPADKGEAHADVRRIASIDRKERVVTFEGRED